MSNTPTTGAADPGAGTADAGVIRNSPAAINPNPPSDSHARGADGITANRSASTASSAPAAISQPRDRVEKYANDGKFAVSDSAQTNEAVTPAASMTASMVLVGRPE